MFFVLYITKLFPLYKKKEMNNSVNNIYTVGKDQKCHPQLIYYMYYLEFELFLIEYIHNNIKYKLYVLNIIILCINLN